MRNRIYRMTGGFVRGKGLSIFRMNWIQFAVVSAALMALLIAVGIVMAPAA